MQVKIGTSQTEIFNIASIGTISHMLNQTPSVSISINDDGTLAESIVFGSTLWKNVQFQPIYILESTVYLFIGRVGKVEFTKDGNGFNLMILNCEGLSAKLNDVALSKNYIYSEGLVKTANYQSDPDKLLLTDLEGNTKAWVEDSWTYGRDNAILLTDSTSGLFNKVWQVAANGTKAGGMSGFTDYTKSLTIDNTYDEGQGIDGSTVEFILTGVSFADSYKIKRLTLYANYIREGYLTSVGNISVSVQLLKNGVWTTIMDGNGTNYNVTFPINGTDADLKQYLTSESSNYTHVHIRFLIWFMFDDADAYAKLKIDNLALKVEYETISFNPIQKKITDNGDTWIIADDANFYGNGVIGESAAGVKDGDKFQIGENSKAILTESIATAGLSCVIDEGLSYYLARSMIGSTPSDVVRDIVDLEDAYWMERYDEYGNCIITILLRTNFGNSVYTITDCGTYQKEYPSNQYKVVRVWGNQTYAVSAIAIDTDVANLSPLEFKIYDEKINTQQDAQQLADSTLARYKTIRPSLVIELKDETSLQVGMNITYNSVVYPIRRIDYSKQYPNGHLRVKVYLGLGQSPPEETLARTIQKALRDAHESKVDRINVSSSSGIPIISYTNLIDKPNIPTIEDTPTNGHTTIAASSNSVYNGLAGKANNSHSHAESDITNLVSDLSAKQNDMSADADATYNMSRAAIGGMTVGATEYAFFGHRDQVAAYAPAIAQDQSGNVLISAAADLVIGSATETSISSDVDVDITAANNLNQTVGDAKLISFSHGVNASVRISKTVLYPATDKGIDLGGSNKQFKDIYISNQLKSSLAVGTKPLDVTSTTVCTNLNADLLDGTHLTDLALKSSTDALVCGTIQANSGSIDPDSLSNGGAALGTSSDNGFAGAGVCGKYGTGKTWAIVAGGDGSIYFGSGDGSSANTMTTRMYYTNTSQLYIEGNCSALSFTDRTPYPKNLDEAIAAIKSMNRITKKNNEISVDHNNLHSFIKHISEKRENGKVIGVEVGRDLSATVSAQNEVIKHLLDEKDAIRAENLKLTADFQTEFNKINEFMGCLNDKLSELQSRIKSIEDSKSN